MSSGRALRLNAPTISTKVQHRLVEHDAHESWICEVQICTQNSRDAQNMFGREL
jgi:hypothetical protein